MQQDRLGFILILLWVDMHDLGENFKSRLTMVRTILSYELYELAPTRSTPSTFRMHLDTRLQP